MYKTAYNTTDTPLVVDDDGRVLPARSFGTVQSTAEQVKSAVERGEVVFHDRPSKNVAISPEAKAAFDETDRVADRAAKFDGFERDALAVLAGAEGDTPTKAALVHSLALGDEDVPTKAEAKQQVAAAEGDKTSKGN